MIIDYSKTVIYKIFCKDSNITDTYIGHTTNFNKRKNQHKHCCYNENKKSYNLKVYQYIRNNGGWNNFEMVMIEEYSCNSKLEAEKRERYFIEELKATLNIVIPTRTKKEYNKDYREKKKEYDIIYRKDNKDKIKEYHKEYRIINKEIIKELKKEYYENNKEKIKERNKKYNENNKEKIKEKFNCECGGCYTKINISKHYKTKIHQEYLK